MTDSRSQKIRGLESIVVQLRKNPNPPVNWAGGEVAEDGVQTFGYVNLDPVLYDAMHVLYEHGIIMFDWMRWSWGQEYYQRMTPGDAADLDRALTLKFLSYIAREDRFCESSWAEMFASGVGTALFERWLELEKAGG